MPNPPALPVAIVNNNPGAQTRAHGPWLTTRRYRGLAVFDSMDDGLRSLWFELDGLYRHLGARTALRLVARREWVREFPRWMLVEALATALGIPPDEASTEDLRLGSTGRMLTTMRTVIAWSSGTPDHYRRKGTDWCTDVSIIGAIQRGSSERVSAQCARSSQVTRYRWNCSHLRPDLQSSSETHRDRSSAAACYADMKS
jgi:hypothetical protein